MIRMTGTTNVQKKKSYDLSQIILIVGIIVVMYFGMKDFIYDEINIPYLNIYISARLCAVISVLFVLISLCFSYYINKLKKTEDWILGIIVPTLFLSSVRLLQYREKFLFAIVILAVMLFITVYGIKTIISHKRNGLCQYIESDFRLINISVMILGIITTVVFIITRNTYLKTVTVDKFTVEQTEKYSGEFVEHMSNFHPDKWEELSDDEKIEALCFLVKYEEDKRNINTVGNINIVAETNDLLAYYNYSGKTIVINENFFLTEDSYSIMNSVLHEFYHSWQYYIVDEYNTLDDNGKTVVELVSDVDKWADELGALYVDGSQEINSFINYYGQYVEESAREYGEERCAEYKEDIEKLINRDMY